MSLALSVYTVRILEGFWYQSGWNQFQWPWPVNLVFSLVLAGASQDLLHRHVDRNGYSSLSGFAVAGFVSVWVIATPDLDF